MNPSQPTLAHRALIMAAHIEDDWADEDAIAHPDPDD